MYIVYYVHANAKNKNITPWRSCLVLYLANDTPFWLSASWKCGFSSFSKPPTPFSPHPAFYCLKYHLLYWEQGYNKCRTCALSSHMTIFTIPNLLTVSKWWQYYRIFAESLQHYLKMCLECDLQYDTETRISERQQNTGIRAVHSNVWGMWLQSSLTSLNSHFSWS